MEDNYKYKENTLLHAIGFDLYKLDSIFKHGILSSDEAKKEIFLLEEVLMDII